MRNTSFEERGGRSIRQTVFLAGGEVRGCEQATGSGSTYCVPGQRCSFARFSASCENCSAGLYSPHGMVCDTCRSGSNASAKQDACVGCPAGTAGTDGRCEPCPAGRHAAKTNQTACAACVNGTHAATPGHKKCTRCPAGKRPNTQRSSCEECPYPTYFNVSKGACIKCDAGRQRQTAASAPSPCELCAPGKAGVGGQCSLCSVGQAPNQANTSW